MAATIVISPQLFPPLQPLFYKNIYILKEFRFYFSKIAIIYQIPGRKAQMQIQTNQYLSHEISKKEHVAEKSRPSQQVTDAQAAVVVWHVDYSLHQGPECHLLLLLWKQRSKINSNLFEDLQSNSTNCRFGKISKIRQLRKHSERKKLFSRIKVKLRYTKDRGCHMLGQKGQIGVCWFASNTAVKTSWISITLKLLTGKMGIVDFFLKCNVNLGVVFFISNQNNDPVKIFMLT